MSKILITGATGHLGKATIEHLLKITTAEKIVAFTRNLEKATSLIEKGIEIRIGDFDDTNSLDKAMPDISSVLLISALELHRFQQHKNVVDAAKRADVKHIAYTGVALRDIDSSVVKPAMESHFQTEDYIKGSGLNYTFLRNTLYADAIPMFTGAKVLETGIIYLPTGDGKTPFASRNEMGEAIAIILTKDGHKNKTYSLTNIEAYTFQNIADILSNITGKKIKHVSPTPEEYIRSLENANIPKEFTDMLTGFSLAQSKNEFNVISNDLENLLGRKPISLKEFLEPIYKL